MTEDHARIAIAQLREETGRTPSVLAAATRLGLANTTFRRRFAGLVDELTRGELVGADGDARRRRRCRGACAVARSAGR